MGFSIIDIQEQAILQEIVNITGNDWKVLVLDETSKKIVYNVVKEDDILNKNVSNIELIEQRRDMNPTMDAIYLLSPQPHIVDCLLADLDRKRYRRAFLLWTSVIDPKLRQRIDSAPAARQQIASFSTLSIDFFPRESHLVTFRDPWSFPILYHPDCNDFVRQHMEILAQKIASVCISAGEYPKVRYYRPRNATHEASVLCTHLARFVQDQLDEYARWEGGITPPSGRPPSIMVITDRSMDLMAPLLHEFTYQAMAHDCLPIKDGDKTTFHMTRKTDKGIEEAEDMELKEEDSVWVENRHRHMKDTIQKLMADFQKFLDQNANFTQQDTGNTTTVNTIKDMMAGLPKYLAMKEAYSLHITMAQECMDKFDKNKLPDVAAAEQTMSTGLDEDNKRPRNILEEVARLLDDEAIVSEDRLRLIMIYVLYRKGVILEDINRLLAHAGLPKALFDTIVNLELLGGRPARALKEPVPQTQPLFPPDPRGREIEDGFFLSRFEPSLRTMLDLLCRGQLDQATFPYVNPPLDPNEDTMVSQNSLRAAQPRWASDNRRVVDNRQRIFVVMAGGATYSESRACYEVSAKYNKDVVLSTSHMLTPHLFCRQVGDLSADPRQLDLPLARPKPKAPAHLFEREPPKPPPQQQLPRPGPTGGAPGMAGHPRPAVGGGQRLPTQQLANMSLNSGGGGGGGGGVSGGVGGGGSGSGGGASINYNAPPVAAPDDRGKHHKPDKEKKKRNIFGKKKY